MPFSCYNNELPENFENALMNALSVRVEDRSETADTFLQELISEEPVKRRVSSIRRIDFMRWPLWAKIGVPASAMAAITLIVLLAVGVIGFKGAVGVYKLPDGMTRVPDTINASVDDAQKWLEEAVLQVTQAGTVYSPGLPENVVLAQDVSAGSVVMKNTMLSLTVSTGKEIYQMPDLTGMTEDYARRALECMGVAVAMQDGEKSGISANCVTAQSIEPYAEVGTGDEVTLTVSRGIRGTDGAAPYLVGLSYENALSAAAEAGLTLTVTRKEFSHDCAEPTIKTQAVQASETAADGTVGVELLMPWHSFQMPNLNYKTEGDATQILANMGVHANVSQESNELIAAGLVFAQDRAKGETLEPGDTVAITVSTGGKPFAMPSIVGMSESEAKKLLAEAGLAVEVEYSYDANAKEGNVISQSIEANTDVTRGTTVKLVVCSRDGLVTVASVIGMSRDAAESAIKGQNLKVTVNLIECDDSQAGQVLSQLPAAGSSQKEGTTIVLTVGKGGARNPKPEQPEPTPDKKDPGPWSDWSTSMPSGDYDVEQKTQYRYRDKESTSSTSRLDGWTLVDTSTSYGGWGNWSNWTDSAISSSNTRQIDKRTTYMYCYFYCYSCGTHWHGYGFQCPSAWGGGCGRSTIQESSYTEIWGTTPQSQMNWEENWNGTSHACGYYNGQRVFRNIYNPNASRTEYRYRDRAEITIYYYERWEDWSDWSDSAVSSSSDRQVETRTVYRYRTKGT